MAMGMTTFSAPTFWSLAMGERSPPHGPSRGFGRSQRHGVSYPFGAGEGYFLPSNAGDINGDGYDDIVVSTYKTVVSDTDTPFTTTFSTGGAVLYGKPSWTSETEILQRDGINGVAIVQPDPELGSATVTGAGDVNKDGFDDLLIGYASTGWSVTQSTMRIVYGGASLGSAVDIGELDGIIMDSHLIDPSRQVIGGSAVAVGDFSGDGIDDIVMRGLEPDQAASPPSYTAPKSSDQLRSFSATSFKRMRSNFSPRITPDSLRSYPH